MSANIESLATRLEISIPPSGGHACLVFIYPRGPAMGSRHPLKDRPILIGRGDECDVHIDDPSMSRRHARVLPSPDGFYVEDLRSTNGTFVNDVPVVALRLKNGDYLRTGNCIFRFLADGNIETAYHEEIYRLAIIDALTGIHNRRYVLEFLDRELSRSVRYQRPLSLVLLDIDNFKQINDRHGHLAGDFVLRELAGMIKPVVRTEELLARYGGEEFAIVLPETPPEGAVLLAHRVRELVAKKPFQFERQRFEVTISLGVAGTLGGESTPTPEELLSQADQKLYQAKREGRNRVCG